MSDAQAIALAENMPLLAGFRAEEKRLLLSQCRVVTFPAKQFLFHHGDALKAFYIISKGSVQLFRITPDGHELTSDVLVNGDFLCVSDVFNQNNSYQINARTLTDTITLQIPAGWLRFNLMRLDHLGKHLLAAMSEKLFLSQVETEHQATMNAPQLIACLLQQICVAYDLDPAGFDLPYNKSLIASRLGIELETFSRSLPRLKRHGIAVHGNHVSISDREVARRFVCDFCTVAEQCEARKALDGQGRTPRRSSSRF